MNIKLQAFRRLVVGDLSGLDSQFWEEINIGKN